MPRRSVLVTYTLNPTPPAPSTGIRSPLNTALAGIRSQLPLTNLHWKSSSRAALRTIQICEVDIKELGEVGTIGKEVSGSVLEWPLVNLCLVTCENDEVYKTQTRSFIRDWLSLLAARRNVHAPLIVLVNTASTAASSGKNVFGRDKGVIAKLRTDFNTGKRDRCVQVNLPPEGKEDPAVWVEVINKLKESIVTAFDGTILEREEEVKRGESQRLTVGWNFCTWFLLKESLAHSFEGVNLHEDALVVYEELEAAFLQILKEQNLSWFGKLGANGPSDDSLPILDTTAKPYRELLQGSAISIFDFRIYVFARQAQLLGKLGRITEIAKRGQWFVASLTRRLRESEADLAENFIESWTYTACMDIVHKCDEWSRIDRPNGDYSGLIAYESARSELLDIARVQVERIGVAVGHLPNIYPFTPSSALATVNDDVLFESSDNGLSDSEEPDTLPPRPSLSNPQLLDAIADQGQFRAFYLTITKRAINAYEACHKANSVLRLKADLAALALLSEDWNRAYDLCRDLAKEYVELGVWESATKFALAGALRAHQNLTLGKDDDWLNLSLAYLGVVAAIEADLQDEDLEDLRNVIRGFDDGNLLGSQDAEDHKAFQITLAGSTISHGEDPGVMTTDISFVNRLPIAIEIGSLTLDFIDVTGEQIRFARDHFTIQPGPNVISVSSNTSVQGLFHLQETRVSLGTVGFLYRIPGADISTPLKIQRDPNGVKLVLRMPYEISLDQESCVVVEVHGGQSEVKGAKLSLASIQGDVQYLLDGARSDDGTAVSVVEGTVDVGDISPHSSVLLSFPYSGMSQSDMAKARLELTYRSTNGDERSAIDVQKVSLGLPLTVNVQDFFRPECLVSHFTIASDGREYLRVRSVKLDPGSEADFEVESARKNWNVATVVTPAQPLSCLFRISRKAQKAVSNDTASAVLRLVISYIGIEEEIAARVDASLRTIEDRAFSRRVRSILQDKAAWLQSYVASGSLDNSFLLALRNAENGNGDQDRSARLAKALKEEEAPGAQHWRTLEIPVDVPQRRLLTKARFEHTSADGMVYEGRALAMNVSLLTTFAWVGTEHGRDVKLVWDIVAGQDDWIVLGRKKGYYIAQPDRDITQEIVLVPVRPGKLFFPSIQVQHLVDPPCHQDDEPPLVCETYVENSGDVVHVLPAKSSRTVMIPVGTGEWDG